MTFSLMKQPLFSLFFKRVIVWEMQQNTLLQLSRRVYLPHPTNPSAAQNEFPEGNKKGRYCEVAE